MLSKDDIIRELSANSVLFELIEHAAASTVEAQTEALASSLPGHVIKNLFLKVSCACALCGPSREEGHHRPQRVFMHAWHVANAHACPGRPMHAHPFVRSIP